MNNANKYKFKVTVISAAVVTMFMAGSSFADDAEVKALTQPQSSVQVEAISVDSASAKFGEYNGLNRQGAYPNGGLNIKGGSGYTNNEQGETTRWSVTGENLGLTTRSAGAEISDQGSWSAGVAFDQLQHNISNNYQTPYQGKMGGNTFTLPSNLQGNITSTTNSNTMNSLGEMGVSTTRNNTTLKGQAIVDKDLNFTFEYNNLTQTGAKLQAFSGAGWASVTASPTTAGRTAYSNGYSQMISILPTPINYQTDTVNLAANWKSENAHLTTSYFGSFFQNANSSVSWQPFSTSANAGVGPNPMQTMSLAPNNAFNQLNVGGGYDFTKQTKLTSNVSVGQNTQNQGYAYDPAMMQTSSPAASMNGLVNTTHADIKVTDQSVKDLTLAAAAKYDNRDNLSQSNMYSYFSIGGTNGYTANAPMSIKQAQLSLSGAYKISKDQRADLTFSQNNINRWCNQYGSTSATTVLGSSGSPTGTGYLNSSNCASATASQENKAEANYKIKATEDVNVKFGAGYSNRKTQWDQAALTEMPGPSSSQTSTASGYNGGNYNGFMPFFEASRKQFVGKANANWQATEQLGFNLGGKYTNDTYPDSTYGVQNGYSWSLNLDSTYAYAEDGSVNAYATQQNMQRSLTDYLAKSASGTTPAYSGGWNNTLTTNATTVGLGAKQGGFLAGKLTLTGDATFSFATSNYGTQVNYTPLAAGGVANPCSATANMTCGSLPGIKNNMAAIKFGGVYQVDKNSRIGLQYWFQHLYSNDYYYNGYQAGTNPSGVMPTQQTNPSYSVNVISANYTYTFD